MLHVRVLELEAREVELLAIAHEAERREGSAWPATLAFIAGLLVGLALPHLWMLLTGMEQ